ncbi:MAG TPA: dihydrodipicolinate synthase family protein [Betaproteobacteria bacterium]|nr:dihydrodipicolinate synthase family protein [Betaproteobacteria bacterium]
MSVLLNESAKGVYVIASTPFLENGEVDFASIDKLVEFYVEEGAHGLTVLGIMGEAQKLTEQEKSAVLERYIKRVAGRLPIIVGASNPGIDNIVNGAKSYMDNGAAGVMISGIPGLNTDEKVRSYFDHILLSLDGAAPVCIQDYPQTTGATYSVQSINQLINDHPGIVMFKHEDAPGHQKLTRIRMAPETDNIRRVSILVGNGGLYIPQELARGADGIMTGLAFPSMLVEVYEKFANGDTTGGEDLYDTYLPFIRHEQQLGIGLAIRKEVLRRRGVINFATVRAPGPKLNDVDMNELTGLIDRLKSKLTIIDRSAPSGL